MKNKIWNKWREKWTKRGRMRIYEENEEAEEEKRLRMRIYE